MLKTKRYLYVGFMCQQAVEKLLKALIASRKRSAPPRSHDLLRLAKDSGIIGEFSGEQIEFCAMLTPFCIETRYAEERERLAKLANASLARELLKKTKGLLKWLNQRLV